MKISISTNGETKQPSLDLTLEDANGDPLTVVEALTIRISANGPPGLVTLDGVDLDVIGTDFDISLDGVEAEIPELAELRSENRSLRAMVWKYTHCKDCFKEREPLTLCGPCMGDPR
jgi:hypothetical protein